MTRNTASRVERVRSAGAVFGLCLMLCLPAPAEALPDVEKPDAEKPADAPDAKSSRTAPSGPIDAEAKKQALTLGFVMLASIIIGGTILLILVVLWGNRARRLARSPLPEVAERDELWFLKPKKSQNVSETGANASGAGPDPE